MMSPGTKGDLNAADALRDAIRRNGAAHDLMAELGRMGIFAKIEGDHVRWSSGWSTRLSAVKLQAIERQAAGIKAILLATERDRRERRPS